MNEFSEIDDQKVITTINGEEKECDLLLKDFFEKVRNDNKK